MRSILILNSKGGTGKTTLACNLAAWFANEGRTVALVDYDRQRSALDWLALRSESRPKIHGIDGTRPNTRLPRGIEFSNMDSPDAARGKMLQNLLQKAQTALLPIVPSTIDLNAAEHFFKELLEAGRIIRSKVRVATVANRVLERSPGTDELDGYLRGLKLPNGRRMPFVTNLRSSQNYVHASERGLGICELAPSRTVRDMEMWVPLLRWLKSKRSLPS